MPPLPERMRCFPAGFEKFFRYVGPVSFVDQTDRSGHFSVFLRYPEVSARIDAFFPDAKPGRLVFDTERRACSVVWAVQDKSDDFIGIRQGVPADFHRVIIRAGGAIRNAGSGDFSSFGHVDYYAGTGLSGKRFPFPAGFRMFLRYRFRCIGADRRDAVRPKKPVTVSLGGW